MYRASKKPFRHLLISAALFVAFSMPTQASAQSDDGEPESAPNYLPNFEQVLTPSEQLTLIEFLTSMSRNPIPDASTVAEMDKTLATLRTPSKLRGIVQFWRASALGFIGRNAEAIEAIEESIRLLPDYSGPLISASAIYAYGNQPGRGADYFLRASKVDAESVRRVDDYEIDNLLRRLNFERDERRINAISDRLLEIGWTGKTLGSRSSLVRAAIKRRIKDNDVPGARALVTKLLLPSHSYSLLILNDFKPIWDDVEAWSGPKLEKQWEAYLHEARQRWAASQDPNTVREYVTALIDAGHDETVIRDVLPIFYGDLDQRRDQDLQFVVSPVAGALARLGRFDDVQKLFERTQAVWPLAAPNVNSLNVEANWARFLLVQGKLEPALEKIDRSLDLAKRWEVNPDAIGTMHHYRACILHELKRDNESAISVAIASAIEYPSSLAHLHLCTGKPDLALKVLLEGLGSDITRDDVLTFVQKTDLPSIQTEYDRRMQQEFISLRSNPELIAKARRYGRMLAFGYRDGAPSEAASTAR